MHAIFVTINIKPGLSRAVQGGKPWRQPGQREGRARMFPIRHP